MTADWNDRATAAIADAIGAVQQRFVGGSPTPTQLASAAMAALAPLLLERDAILRSWHTKQSALEAEREAVARNWL